MWLTPNNYCASSRVFPPQMLNRSKYGSPAWVTSELKKTEDPEKAFDRAMETYLKKGYSPQWINQRLKSIEVRKELTDEWDQERRQKRRRIQPF